MGRTNSWTPKKGGNLLLWEECGVLIDKAHPWGVLLSSQGLDALQNVRHYALLWEIWGSSVLTSTSEELTAWTGDQELDLQKLPTP